MTPLVRLVTRLTLPIALLISLTHLVGADSGPGDGFTGGIISALGVTLQYVVFGYQEASARLRRIPFTFLVAAGLILAFVAGLLPLFFGEPFMGLVEAQFHLPALGELHLDRAQLFDLGIYFVVLGSSVTVIDSLGRAIE